MMKRLNIIRKQSFQLSEYLPKYKKILYRYDFGDDWRHYIEIDNIIEDCGEILSLLLSGEGDAPPEDLNNFCGLSETQITKNTSICSRGQKANCGTDSILNKNGGTYILVCTDKY
jgi:hypothetical protein